MLSKNDTDRMVDEMVIYADRVRFWIRTPVDDIQAAPLELADRIRALDTALTDGAPWPAMWTQVER